MAKIWKNRIEAGTQKLSSCPLKYRTDVIELIRTDLEKNVFQDFQLRELVTQQKMTVDEYEEITGRPFNN